MVASEHDATKSMSKFLDTYKPDTVLTWESPGSWEFPALWKRKGVRWVNVVHWEWFNPRTLTEWKSAELIAPNSMTKKLLLEHYRLRSTQLAVPVDTDRFTFRERSKANTFISIYGHGGPHNRRALPEILMAWSEMEDAPPLVIKAQSNPLELSRCLPPESVCVEVAELPEPEDLYLTGDVAIQVSRYEGVGLCLLEAMASGIPVITTKGPPMSDLAPFLYVEPDEINTVYLAGKDVTVYTPSASDLRRVVSEIRKADLSDLSVVGRQLVEREYSWNSLRYQWLRFLQK